MKSIQDEHDKQSYVNLVGQKFLPNDNKNKYVSEFKLINKELQIITSILASMISVAVGLWWAGGTMNPSYVSKTKCDIINLLNVQ